VLWQDGGGVAWQAAERLARGEHEHYKMHDSWGDAVDRWLDDVDPEKGGRNRDHPFTTGDVMARALGITVAQQRPGDQKRVGKVLQELGFQKDKNPTRVGGGRVRYWHAR